MCGIAGASWGEFVNIDATLESLAHRGPDNLSYFRERDVILLHSLLSTRGQAQDIRQPVTTDCGRWAFVYNGEIYNIAKLRKLLGQTDLQDKSDTLLLARMITRFGLDFIRHIDGMFAIGLLDRHQQKLYLYKDQSGQKNIYYRFYNSDIFFASELQAVTTLTKTVINQTNHSGLRLSAHLGYWPGQETLIQGIKRLLPGQILEFDLTSKCYQLDFIEAPEQEKISDDNQFEQLISSVFDANCKVALNLSGGMDSSIILHELCKKVSSVSTYTTFYTDCAEEANSEAVLARKLAKHYGSNHTEYEISKQQYIDGFETAYATLDEPNYNVSIPIYHQLAKFQGAHGQGERVLFSGDGGDEVFWGYPHYRKSYWIDKYSKYLTEMLFSKLYTLKSKGRRVINFADPIERWLFFKFWEKSFLTKPVSRDEMALKLKAEFSHLYPKFKKNTAACHSTMMLDRYFWLAGENFTRVDKIYMDQSVEVRLPFALPGFVSLIDDKIRQNIDIGRQLDKGLIRQKYDQKLPDYITTRMSKVGWRGPMEDWYSKEMKELFLDNLPTRNSELIRWKDVRNFVCNSKDWPGKQIHWYLSVALLGKKFKIDM